MDVFTVAGELLGDVRLTAGQLGQLRALNYRLLLESPPRGGEPSRGDEADLRARIATEIMQMLSPDQLAQVKQP